jgi:hypothetical protein
MLRLFSILLPLALAACAETVTSDQVTSSTTLQRGYDKTLTKSEQQAVISDLEGAKAKQKGEGTQESPGTAGANAQQTN